MLKSPIENDFNYDRQVAHLFSKENVEVAFHPHLTIASLTINNKSIDTLKILQGILSNPDLKTEDVQEVITKEELTNVADALGLFDDENYKPNNLGVRFTEHTIDELLKTNFSKEDALYQMIAARGILVASNREYSDGNRVTIGQHGDFGYWRGQLAPQFKAANSLNLDDGASRWGTDGLLLLKEGNDFKVINSGFDPSNIKEKFQHQNLTTDTLRLSEVEKLASDCGLTTTDQKGLMHYTGGDLSYWTGTGINGAKLEQIFYAMALVRAAALKDENIQGGFNISWTAEQLVESGIFA